MEKLIQSQKNSQPKLQPQKPDPTEKYREAVQKDLNYSIFDFVILPENYERVRRATGAF
jgi:hypothetical protein